MGGTCGARRATPPSRARCAKPTSSRWRLGTRRTSEPSVRPRPFKVGRKTMDKLTAYENELLGEMSRYLNQHVTSGVISDSMKSPVATSSDTATEDWERLHRLLGTE